MKLLLVQSLTYVPTLGGANKGNRSLIEGLAQRGHDCRVVTLASDVPGPAACGELSAALSSRGIEFDASLTNKVVFHLKDVTVHAMATGLDMRHELKRQIREFGPGWTLVSCEDPAQGMLESALEANSSRVVSLVQTTLTLPFGPGSFLASTEKTGIFKRANGIIANCKFLSDYMREWGDVESRVISFPAFGSAPFPCFGNFSAGFVTMVNPSAMKGISIFLKLAQELPAVKFAAVPTWGTTAGDRARLEELPNVTVLEPTDDIDEIFARTRILLLPSLWSEAVGYIGIEAMLRGIPVVASNVGGVPESKLGVDYVLPVIPITKFADSFDERRLPIPAIPEQDITPWRKALTELISDRSHYERLSAASRDAALEFVSKIRIEPFEEYLASLNSPGSSGESPSSKQSATQAVPASGNASLLDQLSPEKRALLALRLKAKRRKPTAESVIARRHGASAPLSFAQQRIWFLEQLEPDQAHYNIPAAVALSGQLDVAALRKSLAEIVRRHEVLRTTFNSVGDEVLQVVSPDTTLDLEIIDLRASTASDREAASRQIMLDDGKEPFDLVNGPLFRARLLCLSEDEYILLLTIHHIVSDGWSMGILIGEISALYEAFSQNKISPLAELPIQYADFSSWQRECLSSKVLDNQLAFWREQLSGELGNLDLRTDRPRSFGRSMSGAKFSYQIPVSLRDDVRNLAQQCNASMFMTLMAAFQALLHRYTGQREIILGSPIAGRNRAETERLIGCFVNTLVFRSTGLDTLTFAELLEQVKAVALGAYAHQDIPFEKLVEELQPERNRSLAPIFQVMFALHNLPMPGLSLPGLTLRPLEREEPSALFELMLSTEETREGLGCSWVYSTDLFDAGTIERMAGHYERLLRSIVANPDARLVDLMLLTEEDQRQQLVEWNETARAYASERTMAELFEEQVGRSPGAVAVVYEEEELSYEELNGRANRLAHYLRRRGVVAGTLVGVYAERSLELLVGLLGVLKAGAAYLPLDLGWPPERVEFVLREAAVGVVLMQQRLVAELGTVEAQRICLDTEWEAIARESEAKPERRTGVTELAYVIYTSGSSGKPKGVEIGQRALTNFLCSVRAEPGLTAADVMLAVTTISFDIAGLELYLPLLVGARVVLASVEAAADGRQLQELIRRSGATVMQGTPATWRLLLEAGWEGKSDLKVLCGGEALTRELAKQLLERSGSLWNLYGPTETTIWSAVGRVRGSEGAITIGRPLANTQFYLLDGAGRLAPVGVVGELYIGGDGLARGYLQRPELTAESFVPDAFGGQAGGRLYRSGDLARYLANGELEVLGRRDQQVKLRGYRIELSEIETMLRQQEQVRDCVVVAGGESGSVNQRLVAYVVSEGGVSVAELRQYLQGRMPGYMVPSVFVELAALPMTASGKVDRRALPEPENWGSEESEYLAPRTAVEEALAGIWGEVLQVAAVGVNDNFFALGGHSLLATQVLARVRRQLQVEVGLRQLFEQPTVAALAQTIARQQGEAGELPAAAIAPGSRTEPLPLSFAQQRLWFLEQLEPGLAVYHMQAGVSLHGALNVSALARALNEVTRRHEVLRTSFTSIEGRAVQVIAPAITVPLVEHELSDLVPTARAAAVQRLSTEEAQRPFDLVTGPLFRTSLLRFGEHDHVLLLTMHHIVSDGWSLGLLVKEVEALYTAFSSGRPTPLSELAIQYADYAVWQRQQLQGATLEQQLNYWREQLRDAPVLDLPRDRARPAVQGYAGASFALGVGPHLSAALKQLSQQSGTTLFMTLLAAFQELLHRYSGQTDIVVGSPVAGRTQLETENLIGFFVNTLALRTNLSGDPTFRELLGRVREVTLQAYAHQEVPFEAVVEEVQPARSLSYTPIFQVMLALQNARAPQLALPGLTLERLELLTNTAKFDLTLLLEEEAEGLSGLLEYSTDLFDGATIQRLLGHFQTLLETVVANPDQRLSDVVILSKTEEQQQLVEWNETARAYASERTMVELFEEQVGRSPGAVAVVYEEEELSYEELNSRANRLAHYLRRRGVVAGTLVGVYAERSLELLVGLLGVLKAGAAYLPLDLGWPPERVEFVLREAAVGVVLMQQRLVAELGTVEAQRICLDTEWEAIARESEAKPERRTGVTELAYVIYTSGSSGKPKGVEIGQRALTNFLCSVRAEPGLTAADVMLAVTTISFDIAGLELYLPLLVGARVVLASVEAAADGRQLQELIRRSGATVMQGTPATWRLLLEAGWEGKSDLKVLCGGEALTRELAKQLLERSGSLWNLYGPTETTIWSAVGRVRGSEGAITIGRPLANTQFYLLDGAGRLAPVGVVGELYIGGDGLARGYLQRPELTAESFVPDAFGGQAGGRLYRSGDLARYLANGELEVLGRRDQQVKLRGYRIELSEIETMLRQQEQVRDCVVVAGGESGSVNQRLVAYVVSEGGVSVAELRQYLQGRMPGYMVPSVFVELAALPMTASGKVDRRALPEPENWGSEESEYLAPRTAVEEALAGIWGEVLQVAAVGVNDNFFALGGHSLLATQVLARVRRQLQVEVGLRQLFEQPTVAALAQTIARQQGDAGELPAAAIAPGSRTEPPPLSFAQQRLWFLEQLTPHTSAYNIAAAVRLTGPLDPEVLQRTLNEIFKRHEVLRTTFTSLAGSDVQIISAAAAVPFPVVDLSEFSQAEQDTTVRRLAAEEAQRPFDLTRGPLLRFSLLRLGAEQHIILTTMHHIIGDGWSSVVLFREIGALYTAYAAGQESPLGELPVQYADYAVWQREYLSGEVLERQVEYWRQQLAGAAPVLELPADRVRPAVQSYRGASVRFAVGQEVTNGLKALSQREGVTLFMTLLAAFKVLLYRYTGQEDIVVGSPIAGRTRAEVENLIGFFVNTLVLRTDLSGAPGFRELLGRMRETALGAYAHQDVPFEKLVDELRPERDLSYSPLFQVLFVLQNVAPEELQLAGLELQFLEVTNETVKFDLTLTVAEEAEGLRASLHYNTDLFAAATIERMVGNFQVLLAGILSDQERPLAQLPLMSEAERRQVLVDWNQTQAAYPQPTAVHELFEQQAARTPEAIALRRQEQSLTYRELNYRANQLAHQLCSLGVGPEVLVGILLERSVELVVSLLAVLKAGGAYVPLDPQYPAERLSFMIGDAGAKVLLTQKHLVESFPRLEASVVCLDDDWQTIAAGWPAHNPPGDATRGNAAYVIYTSGSTGTPKGVVVEHHSLCNHLLWRQATYPLHAADRFLHKASISFDIAVWEIFAPLIAGAQLVLAEPGGEKDAAYLTRTMATQQITMVYFGPAMLQEVLAELGLENCVSLRHVFCGGDSLTFELQRRFYERLKGSLHHQYGPTETTVDVTVRDCGRDDQRQPVPIGRPIANTEIYILDPQLQPVPVGVPGQLFVGAASLARGYFNRPDVTAEKFLPHPFSTRPGARLYSTGDLARYLADGQIVFLGRIDNQVKVRGFRIELGEVEAVLHRHAEVREAVVIVREDATGEKRLVAYVVSASDVEMNSGKLRATLREKLPEYMIPSAFVQLRELPLTPNGKVDRRALPAPETDFSLSLSYVGPRTPVEELLCGIWSEVLGVGGIGVTDNFFEVGGHSLKATQVVSRIRETFRIELALRTIFESPTIESLAASVKGALATGPRGESPRLEAVGRAGPVGLSFAQQRLWFLHELEPESTAYNIVGGIRLQGALEEEALRGALAEMMRRHESLRTRFGIEKGQPVQIIVAAEPLELTVADLSALAAPEREEEVRRRIECETNYRFNLQAELLFRATLLRVSNDEHVLLVAMHHIISDEWSTRLLFREIGALYTAYASGQESPLGELPVQYADYAVWQREYLSGEVLERQVEYWRQQLAGAAPVLELPADRVRPAVQSYRGASVRFAVDREVTNGLKALSQREGVTLFMTLLAAFKVLLYRYTGQEDIVVGSPIAGRTRAEVENLIGFFVNTLVLRTDLSGAPGFRELLGRMRETALGAYAHQDVPFEKLVDELQPERDLSHSPLFQVMFALRNAPMPDIEPLGLKLTLIDVPRDTAKFDLTLSLTETAPGLTGTFEYNTDLFQPETIERMTKYFAVLLAGIVSDPGKAVAELPMLTAAEREQVLFEWNDTATEYASEKCIHELFAAQVERNPEAVAFVYEAEQISYEELNRRANQLGRYLSRLGVGPENRVGVCLERGLDMVVAWAGVLKAGGAYVPLDPAYPKERLAYMLEDADVRVLITQSSLSASLPDDRAETILIDEQWDDIARESQEDFDSRTSADNLAYVIYTSGSTGKPKGVSVTHQAVVRLVKETDYVKLGPEDRVAQASNSSFDAVTFEIWGALLNGCALVDVSKDVALSAPKLAQAIRDHGITTMLLTTALFNQTAREEPSAFRGMKQVLFGGEAADAHRVRELLSAGSGPERLLNVYGPTEGTTLTTWRLVEEVAAGALTVSIGRPLANTQVYILDSGMEPVAVGIYGELYIAGDGLARCYANKPDLTAEKFVPHPHGIEAGKRLYKTGDIVRYLPDGNIEFLGRRDNQVKVRGFRIEPGEIEAVLSEHKLVNECAIVTQDATDGGKRIIAYFVTRGDETPSAGELRNYAGARLPSYMVPATFVMLAEMPLTPNGKVDHKALSQLEQSSSKLESEYIGPRSANEAMLCEIWAEVLKVEQVGIHDNFFDLGGHSLLATRVITRVNEIFHVKMPLRAMFEAPTVAGMSETADLLCWAAQSAGGPEEGVPASYEFGEL